MDIRIESEEKTVGKHMCEGLKYVCVGHMGFRIIFIRKAMLFIRKATLCDYLCASYLLFLLLARNLLNLSFARLLLASW